MKIIKAGPIVRGQIKVSKIALRPVVIDLLYLRPHQCSHIDTRAEGGGLRPVT